LSICLFAIKVAIENEFQFRYWFGWFGSWFGLV